MLKIARIIEALGPEDRAAVAYEIYRTYGGSLFVPLDAGPMSDAERARRYRERHADRHEIVTTSVTNDVTDRHDNRHDNRDGQRDEIVTMGGTIGGVRQPKSKSLEASTGFQAFWLKYPKRVGKGAAQDAWNKGACETHAAFILRALENQRNFLLREGGKYIPNPATWLNQRRWEDDPPEPTGLSPKTAGNIAAGQAFIERMAQRGKA